MPLSELVVLLQVPPTPQPYFPVLLAVVPYPAIDYLPNPLKIVPVFPGGAGAPPVPSILAVTAWPAPSYTPADLLEFPAGPSGRAPAVAGIKISFRGIKRRPQETP